ncbi:Ubiquitin supergroup [Penicillium robsamsonii]|uniref:Ubiquitin supergroup n=1 Tax=Penicillium robsamsonii TaxID=1792511 RepID=UPI002547E05C|nr:Ubiquitin supergroup [Penicillium robsamsonii]KAJ5834271.1 Ubiquitin supergroup [Penicillium robsamsonii]
MSFFKKPTWAVKNTGETGTDFYRRSGQTYSDIIAANREAQQKQPKAPEIPEDTEDTEDTKDTKDTKRKKRRRISEEKGKGRDDSSSVQDVTHEVDRVQIVIPKPQELSGSSHDSSPESAKSVKQRETTQTHSPENRMSQSPQKASGPAPLGALPVQPVIVLADDSETRSPRPVEPPRPVQPPKSVDDPVVQIMISSEIANTKPLLVHRKMSQRLRDVRLAWCNRQNFDPHIQSSVYLTWKGRRLFDVTTCRSLGINTEKGSGGILDFDDDSTGQKELRIHMEAVSGLPLPVNQPTAPDNDKSPTVSQPPEEDQGEPMKLILRSLGYDDFRLKARPKTVISRLISAFRDKQKISADQDIFLLFDGDKLDPDSCLGDYDIDDLDLLDVQIK